ncbi:hypothetical protein GmHk_06G016648 [Glycine max]|nr:hypothetical protein GmHk_06G016648 [Glycine max]
MFSSRSVSQPTNIFSVVWNLKVPKKVQYFVWRLVMDRLPTKLNLRRRNIQLHEMQYRCPWCNDEEESSSMATTTIWNTIYSWIDISTTIPQSVIAHFLQHQTRILEKSKRDWLYVIWCATM